MEIELYSTIEYTPGWYYAKYPKFYSVECYKILADYSHHPEKYRSDGHLDDIVLEEMDDGYTEEEKESEPNKNSDRKREYEALSTY